VIGERDFNTAAPVYDVTFVSFRRGSMRPARLLSNRVISFICFSLPSAAVIPFFSPARLTPLTVATCQLCGSVSNARRVFISPLGFQCHYVHAYTCSRNNPAFVFSFTLERRNVITPSAYRSRLIIY